jgi:hypothetical protein
MQQSLYCYCVEEGVGVLGTREEAMSFSYGLRRVVSTVVAASALILIASVAGAAPSPDGPTRSTMDKLAQKRYVAAGGQGLRHRF